MKNLNYSSTLGDYAFLREELKEQGYVLIKNFFTKRELDLIIERVCNILQDKGWGTKNGDHIIPTGSVNRIGSMEFLEGISSMMREEELHLISLKGKLPTLMNKLLCKNVFPHPRKMVRICYPYYINPDDLILPHQDISYVKGEKDTLIAWIPLGNYSPDCGGLKVAHGSHRKGLFPVSPNSEGRFNCSISNIEQYELDWRVSNYEIGDLLVMHSLTLHSSGQNSSNHFRLSLDCRFSCLDGTINEEQLLPPYYPKLPEWSEITKSWGFNPFIAPPSLKIESNDEPMENIMNKPSIFI